MKQCNKCKVDKDFTDFYKNKSGKYGLTSQCKSCMKKYHEKYYSKNKESIKEYQNAKQKIYYKNNKELIKKNYKEYYLNNKEKRKQYNLENKEKIKQYSNQYNKNRKQNDPLFKLGCNIRNLIYNYTKNRGFSKKSKTEDILNCKFETFKLHLEKQFTKGMIWDNYGEWHLDHIYPVSLARNEKHLIELNHYTNFQPLWKKDNISKGNKIIEKQLFLI